MSINNYSACQIKFAFDVSIRSPLSWSEYFGYEDAYDMLYDFCKKHLDSKRVEFIETDYRGCKLCIVFISNSDVSKFQEDYTSILNLLDKLDREPEFNPSPEYFNYMLSVLEDNNITVYDYQPDEKVFEEYNLIEYGFRNYKDHLVKVNKQNV